MDSIAGISMYFRDNRINVRKETMRVLGNPRYLKLKVNEQQKVLFLLASERDKDAIRIIINKTQDDDDGQQHYYVNAKKLVEYLARLIGVERYSESLRFRGIYMEEENAVCIDLNNYEVIPY